MPTTVAVTYYGKDGTAFSATPFVLAGHAVQPIYQGANSGVGIAANGGLPNNFIGAATVTASAGGVVMAVNEAGGLTESGAAQSGTYLATANGSSTVGLPVVANNGNGYTSGVTVLNLSAETVGGTIAYYNPDGTLAGQQAFSIAAHASQLAYQGAASLPNGFYGQAVITQASGAANSLLATTNVQSATSFYSYTEPTQ
jgi:hypothetical protein